LLDDYNKSKADKDKAAFAVLDVNKDGTLQFDEFVKMFGDTEIRNNFFEALGFGQDAFFAKLGELMSAPFLDEAMQKTKAWMDSQSPEDLMGMMPGADPALKEKMDKSYKAHFDSDLKGLLEKSFARHDTKKNNLLDPEEAAVFFGNLIRVMMDVFKHSKKKFASLLAGVLPGSPPVDKVVEAMCKVEEVMLNDYMANKGDRDKKAFDLIDVNKDGSLQLDEFLKLFEDQEQHKKFHAELGFGEEAFMAKLAELVAA